MSVRVSVCSPMHNEEVNLAALVGEIHAALTPIFGQDWEQVLVDDGSTDGSAELARQLARQHHALRLVSHQRNRGERAAWKTAFDAARGEILVMLAADLQNDPRDIPRLVAAVEGEGYGCASGFRADRKDGLFYWCATRLLNAYMATVFRLGPVRDVSSSFFAVRREYAVDLPLAANDHRYILALFRQRGATIIELPTAHRARRGGRSHYRPSKVLRAVPEVLDFTYRFFVSARARRKAASASSRRPSRSAADPSARKL